MLAVQGNSSGDPDISSTKIIMACYSLNTCISLLAPVNFVLNYNLQIFVRDPAKVSWLL